MKTDVVVEFEDETGIDEIHNNMSRIRYSLYMVFSSKSTANLIGNSGKTRSLNSVKKILKRQLESKVLKIELVNFEVTENKL